MADVHSTYEESYEDGVSPSPEDDRRDDRRKRLAITAIILVVVLLIIALFIGRVPSTIGMSRKTAVRRVERAGFRSEVTTVAPAGRPGGRVVDQRPGETYFFKWWTVHLYVTGGYGSAMEGFEPTPTVDLATDMDYGDGEGMPMPSDPEEVDPLYIPRIPSQLVMPNVLNMKESAARRAIRNVGLKVSANDAVSTVEVAKDRVLYQSPTPGSLITPGQTAKIWVSLGPLDLRVHGSGPRPRP